MKQKIEIGLLFSHSGGYENLSLASHAGTLNAVDKINQDGSYPFEFQIVERDPCGNIDLYGALAEDILKNTNAKHIFGCTTSWSRKEVIPSLERFNGTLWYSVPYEGFEASDHVAYIHACPNQHLIPLLKWALPRFGSNAYLIGSNYIWGWELNRLAHEVIVANGGDVLGERYLPIGDLDVGRMIDDIRAMKPDFVLNSLIGTSQYEFLQELNSAGLEVVPPILSCNLTECELSSIGVAAEGLIAAGPYFKTSKDDPFTNSFEEAASRAVFEYANLLKFHGAGAAYHSLNDLLQKIPAESGINARNHHVALPVYVAMVRDGKFSVLTQQEMVPGDPYMTQTKRNFLADKPPLRIVK